MEGVLLLRDAVCASQRLGGMTILERALFSLARAGLPRAWVTMPRPRAALRLPPGLDIRWGARPELLVGLRPRLEVYASHIVRAEALRKALGERQDGDVEYTDKDGQAAFRIFDSSPQLPRPPRGGSANGSSRHSLSPNAAVRVDFPADRERALTWLLQSTRKESDGFMARWFDRRLSLAVTRRLIDTSVTPNHMTLMSTGIGLIGAFQFLEVSHARELLGASLVWLHTVLDGCDGEIARVKHLESPWGRFIDFWGDNAVHIALFACLALDLAHDDPRALGAGAAACLAALGSAWLSYRGGLPQSSSLARGIDRRLRRMETILAQRDFIYLLVLAAALDQAPLFLWAAGIGAPVYFLILVYLNLRSRRPAEDAGGQNTAGAAMAPALQESAP